jgi:hypothetical protein
MNDLVWRKAEELIDHYTQSNGHVDLLSAEADLELFLLSRPELMDPRMVAQRYIEKIDRSRKVSPRGTQSKFSFEPEAWLTVGERERVQMSLATREDVIAHIAMVSENHAGVTQAYAMEMAYWNSRLQAWGKKHKTLGAVEADKFA